MKQLLKEQCSFLVFMAYLTVNETNLIKVETV